MLWANLNEEWLICVIIKNWSQYFFTEDQSELEQMKLTLLEQVGGAVFIIVHMLNESLWTLLYS